MVLLRFFEHADVLSSSNILDTGRYWKNTRIIKQDHPNFEKELKPSLTCAADNNQSRYRLQKGRTSSSWKIENKKIR